MESVTGGRVEVVRREGKGGIKTELGPIPVCLSEGFSFFYQKKASQISLSPTLPKSNASSFSQQPSTIGRSGDIYEDPLTCYESGNSRPRRCTSPGIEFATAPHSRRCHTPPRIEADLDIRVWSFYSPVGSYRLANPIIAVVLVRTIAIFSTGV